MNIENYINEIIKLYFDGYSVAEALKITTKQREVEVNELKNIAQTWEEKAKKAQINNAKGWKYQQASFI